MTPLVKEIVKGVAIGAGTAIILQLINALGGFITLAWIWNNIFMAMWPMWLGLLAACVYWLISFIVKLRKQVTAIIESSHPIRHSDVKSPFLS